MQTYELAPILATAGIDELTVRWPEFNDLVAIWAVLQRHGSDNGVRFYAILLTTLCGLPAPVANRVALAHMPALVAMFQTAFRNMRAELSVDDPRLAEPIPAILAGETSS